MKYQDIPEELKKLKRWITYKQIKKNEKSTI